MLKIIISPAKKMNVVEEAPVEAGTMRFPKETERLKNYLCSLDYGTLKEIWKCNDKLTELNVGRLREMDLAKRVTPAVFAYEGIQYQSMAPMVFEQKALDYIRNHLYILSGFYGLLRAFDGVVPYRLEMQAKIGMEMDGDVCTSLYEYWGRRLFDGIAEDMKEDLAKDAAGDMTETAAKTAAGDMTETAAKDMAAARSEETGVIVNLASQEYAKAVRPWVGDGLRMVDCVFGEWDKKKGTEDEKKVRVKATAAKMARGAMVRYMAEHQVECVEDLKGFSWMGYRYEEELSKEDCLIFVV